MVEVPPGLTMRLAIEAGAHVSLVVVVVVVVVLSREQSFQGALGVGVVFISRAQFLVFQQCLFA